MYDITMDVSKTVVSARGLRFRPFFPWANGVRPNLTPHHTKVSSSNPHRSKSGNRPATGLSVDKMQSTRADFRKLCKAMEGRWIGEVVWVADWPGFGKKGDKFTGYSDFRISHGDT